MAVSGASNIEICAAFPELARHQIESAMSRYKLYHARRKGPMIGIPLVDALQEQCFRLRSRKSDLDDIARTKGYFGNRSWRNAVDTVKLVKTVRALGGQINVTWPE